LAFRKNPQAIKVYIMNNKNELIFLKFGNVAYPFTVEEAINGGACYGVDARVEQIKTTISEIRNALKEFAPLIPPNDTNGTQDGDEGLLEALKHFLDSRKAQQPAPDADCEGLRSEL
jgi:hypothetical protein